MTNLFHKFKIWMFGHNQEYIEMMDKINKICEEYDVHVGPRGGLSRTSKPEYREKHRQEIRDFQKRTKHLLNKDLGV